MRFFTGFSTHFVKGALLVKLWATEVDSEENTENGDCIRMMLHIGADVILLANELIAIIDSETVNSSKINRQKIEKARMEKRLISCEGETKSYVFLFGKGQETIYCSPISSSTLQKRVGVIQKTIQ